MFNLCYQCQETLPLTFLMNIMGLNLAYCAHLSMKQHQCLKLYETRHSREKSKLFMNFSEVAVLCSKLLNWGNQSKINVDKTKKGFQTTFFIVSDFIFLVKKLLNVLFKTSFVTPPSGPIFYPFLIVTSSRCFYHLITKTLKFTLQ